MMDMPNIENTKPYDEKRSKEALEVCLAEPAIDEARHADRKDIEIERLKALLSASKETIKRMREQER